MPLPRPRSPIVAPLTWRLAAHRELRKSTWSIRGVNRRDGRDACQGPCLRPAALRDMGAAAGEREAIRRPPARPLDLALKDAHLVPEDQEFQPEVGVRTTPIAEGLEEQTEDREEEGEKHDWPSCQGDPSPVAQLAAGTVSGIS